MRVSALFLALLICFSSICALPFTVETLHQIRRIGDYSTNLKGDLVYTVRTWDQPTNKVHTILQILYQGTTTPVQFTDGQCTDSSPSFDSVGTTLYFLRTCNGSTQIYAQETSQPGGPSQQISQFPVDVNSLVYFQKADGDYLLFTISVYPDCKDLDCTANRDQEVANRGPNTWRYYDQLFVRHWDHWETGKLSHIFVQKVDSAKKGKFSLEGTPLDLMSGQLVNSPVFEAGLEEIGISPDGNEIAFTGQVVEAAASWSTNWKIYVVPTDGSSAPVWLTTQIVARTTNPRYSPDGSSIAYLAMDRPGFEADRLHINVYNRQTQTTTPWTSQIDISFSDIQWDVTSSFLLADADYMGAHSGFAVFPGKALSLELTGTNQNFRRARDSNVFYFTGESMMQPVELYSLNISAFSSSEITITDVKSLTSENDALLNNYELSQPTRFSFTGSMGDTVYGWVLEPYGGALPGQSYPVAHLVHGGPQGSWLDDWSYRWNPQVWAGQGYGVIMIDFHGSTGYGQDFTDSISGNWGSYPYWDIMNGTFYALKQFSWMDQTRVAALGASYGGFMINWIHGQTDFFKALVTHDGIFDTVSAYYTTEELWFPEWEFKGTPWQNPSLYQKWNPSNYVQNWKVPHLIIHGGHDYRLTLSQGLGAFTALQRRKVPSAFLEFDLENHWVLGDANGIKWYHTVLAWLSAHC